MNPKPPTQSEPRKGVLSRAGFTLIEMLTSIAILGVMFAMLYSVFEQVNRAWLLGENRVETFTTTRAALDLMSRELSQAIATNGIVFHGDTNNVFFVAPVSVNSADQADLCQVGYEFDSDVPAGSGKWAFQLTRHFIEPTSANVLAGSWNIRNSTWWNTLPTTLPIGDTPSVMATNCIVNLQFEYLNSAGNLITPPINYVNQLPYAIVIKMYVVDSRTATKLRLAPTTSWPTITNSTLRSFSTVVYLPNALP
ncbi:MAG TPA: prepilin-type N-terminal cleavage/methylation domain-containing protein [Verrucomicrobiae bacterium]|nr:prepilin-type N-terminal cleavage/methylation domain-containing protein [Verrucomicrobiae bacterium]